MKSVIVATSAGIGVVGLAVLMLPLLQGAGKLATRETERAVTEVVLSLEESLNQQARCIDESSAVMRTSEAKLQNWVAGKEFGVSGGMVKPFEAHALINIVRMLVG